MRRSAQLHHVDVTTAFLNGVLEEEVFMRQPEGYTRTSGMQTLEEYLWTKAVNTVLHAHLMRMNFE